MCEELCVSLAAVQATGREQVTVLMPCAILPRRHVVRDQLDQMDDPKIVKTDDVADPERPLHVDKPSHMNEARWRFSHNMELRAQMLHTWWRQGI